jgi:hypothetical protein
MRCLWIVMGVVMGLLGFPGSACASRAVPGGHYKASQALPGEAWLHVNFRLANDGREFARGSKVQAELHCGGTDVETDLMLAGSEPAAPTVHIHSTGRFWFREAGRSWSDSAAGRFTSRGRRLVVKVKIHDGDADCPRIATTITARLVGHTKPVPAGEPSTCDPVDLAYLRRSSAFETYDAYEIGIGCTAARDLAGAWYTSRACPHDAFSGTCTVRGMLCSLTRGGRFQPLASVSCVSTHRTGQRAEYVRLHPCPSSSPHFWLTSVNLGCQAARAFPLGKLFDPCGQDVSDFQETTRCAPIAGYSCIARPTGIFSFTARCTLIRDSFKTLEVGYDGN